MSWQPALGGTLAADALAAIDDVAQELRAVDPDVPELAGNPTITSGTSGLALFFAELGEATDDESARQHALTLLDDTIESAADAPLVPSLLSGTVGVGWVLEVLSGRLFEVDEDDEHNDVDAMVDKLLEADPWPGTFDVVSGLVGLGVYLLRRLPREGARQSLHTLVQRLGAIAEHTAHGITWRSTPSRLPRTPTIVERFERYPDGYYDLGLAHGAAGTIAFLAAAVRAGEPDAKELLEGATAWLRAQRRADASSGAYPFFFFPGVPDHGARAAWCYGDVSVAVGLLAAGDVLGDAAVVDEALRLATDAASAPVEQSGVMDAGLCHGSAGLAHICNRLGQAAGDERLVALAARWVTHTLRSRRIGEPVAGFPSFFVGDDGERSYEPSFGALEGAAGVGLALLAATTATEPEWDGFLLLGPLTAPSLR